MQTAFQIGNISIRWYGIIFATGVALAYLLISKLANISKVPKKHLEASLYIVLIFGLVGARLYHVADQWDYYSRNLGETIKIWQGGIGIYGGLFGGFFGLILYSRLKHLNILKLLDVITPGVLLAQAIGRWGNFFNQEAYGYPTNLPWAIKIDQANRLNGFENYQYFHPTFLYESALALGGLAILIVCFHKLHKHSGLTFSLYLVIYGAIRLFVEHFRIDTWQQDGIKIAQAVSLAIILIGVVLLISLAQKIRSNKG